MSYSFINYFKISCFFYFYNRKIGGNQFSCHCDFMSFIWNLVYQGKEVSAKCVTGGKTISVKVGTQMTKEQISDMDCSKFFFSFNRGNILLEKNDELK